MSLGRGQTESLPCKMLLVSGENTLSVAFLCLHCLPMFLYEVSSIQRNVLFSVSVMSFLELFENHADVLDHEFIESVVSV